jgi:cytochrome oxidase Cu insertion factor (SCO1/SenC/PrrC family)
VEQQVAVRDLLPGLGTDVEVVSVGVDPNEDAAVLRRYAERHGFPWRFAVAPPDMLRALERSFGTRFLHPPSEPMFLVDTRGEPFIAPYGSKDANTIRQLVSVARV